MKDDLLQQECEDTCTNLGACIGYTYIVTGKYGGRCFVHGDETIFVTNWTAVVRNYTVIAAVSGSVRGRCHVKRNCTYLN